MELYVLIHEHWYEGYREPIGIFSSVEKAKKALLIKEPSLYKDFSKKTINDNLIIYTDSFRDWNIIKYNVDVFV